MARMMVPRCTIVLFCLLLGVGVVHCRSSQRPAPANVDYAKLFSLQQVEDVSTLGTPTIGPSRDFDVDADLATIDAAIADLSGGGIQKLIVIATERSFGQRARLFEMYYKRNSKLLTDVLSDKLGYSSDIFRGLQALLEPAAWRDATYLYEAMAGAGTNDAVLNEVLTTRTYRQLQSIAAAYVARYETTLTDDIAGDEWGVVETVMTKLVTTPRKTDIVDEDRANVLAQELYDAGEGRWGRDDDKFVEILTGESYTSLRLVFQAYHAKFQSTVLQAVDSEFSRKARDLFMTLVRVIMSESVYFADCINADSAGLGTDELGLTRHILARADIDLVEIMTAYQQKYKVALEATIADEVSGDFETLLLAAVKVHTPLTTTSAVAQA